MKLSTLFLPLLSVFAFYSCEKIESYPPVPQITLKNYSVSKVTDGIGNKITQVEFSFDFVDGDGDLIVSLGSSDDSSKLFSKMYLGIYSKENTEYIFSKNDTVLLPYQSYMDRTTARNKTIKGTITYKKIFYSTDEKYDTIQLKWYVIDFALNKSNVLVLDDLPVKLKD